MLEQWQMLGRPSNTEGFQVALRAVRDRRARPRFQLALEVRVSRLDVHDRRLEQEITTTTDLSESGMRVPTRLPLRGGEVVVIEEEGGPFHSRAEVLEVVRGSETDAPCARVRFIDGDAANYIRRLLYTLSR
jgi:hypothetical protein